MARAEILSEIRLAEEEAKSSVAHANEMKSKKISEAQMQAREIIRKADEEAEKYAESEIGAARGLVKEEKEKIIKKGIEEADEIKKKAKNNITKATQFILSEFERAVDA